MWHARLTRRLRHCIARVLRWLRHWRSPTAGTTADHVTIVEDSSAVVEGRMAARLLIIEATTTDPQGGLGATLEENGRFTCQSVDWSAFVRHIDSALRADAIIVVADQSIERMSHILEWLHQHRPPRPLLAVVPPAASARLLGQIAAVADDVIFAPVRSVELCHRLASMLDSPQHEIEEIRDRIQQELGLSNLVGRDPAFLRAIEQLPRYARTDLCVLITGETGTGKELCARALHHLSRRRDLPFIAVDCAALPDQLFESELFGHSKGAFTDAHRDRKGLVALAAGGSLFIDEIDALSLAAQAKLLRFLQERTFRPLGSERVETADVRMIVATNRDLEACVSEKRFRSDLFFRFNVLRLHLPPLRARRADIELLARSALNDCAGVLDHPPRSLSPAALRVLGAYEWPGNVRELVNVVQRAAVACGGEQILPSHLSLPGRTPDGVETGGGSFRHERAAVVAAFERQYVEGMLRKHDGNVTHAAREARQNRRVFGRFMKKYKIDRHLLKV